MKWEELRELYPNQYMLFSVLTFHQQGTRRVIEEVEPIRPVAERDVSAEWSEAGPGKLVYHTASRVCVIRIRRRKAKRVRRHKSK
ncbi:hypothetical protein KIH86_12930 [Paenibacillus sp. HN-1]|uniref:hypothetical protein n=1 Tax=Paenibacillus TaxID=44249 RepID=UPI001CA92668|nr:MULTISPECIES: hypothetical protein [Paenibacillus]MBY9080877.1 hypothetical protein [Paenibacillus sp. CGMCC 1.18879]MBY9085131.1 hypothetical protein [Paenibacillus sinensis]